MKEETGFTEHQETTITWETGISEQILVKYYNNIDFNHGPKCVESLM
jgi:hypothetical protein